MSSARNYIIIVIVGLLTAAALYTIFIFTRGEIDNTIPTPQPTETPIENIIPTPTPLGGAIPQPTPADAANYDSFSIVDVYPNEGQIVAILPNQALGFRLSRPVDLSSVDVEISPEIDFSVSYDGDSFIVYVHPEGNWPLGGEYIVSLKANSRNGEVLSGGNYSAAFTFLEPTQDDYDELEEIH